MEQVLNIGFLVQVVYQKVNKIMRIQRMDGSDDGQAGEYIIGENGVITPRKFNPWNADIHYGLTVNPADRGLVTVSLNWNNSLSKSQKHLKNLK